MGGVHINTHARGQAKHTDIVQAFEQPGYETILFMTRGKREKPFLKKGVFEGRRFKFLLQTIMPPIATAILFPIISG